MEGRDRGWKGRGGDGFHMYGGITTVLDSKLDAERYSQSMVAGNLQSDYDMISCRVRLVFRVLGFRDGSRVLGLGCYCRVKRANQEISPVSWHIGINREARSVSSLELNYLCVVCLAVFAILLGVLNSFLVLLGSWVLGLGLGWASASQTTDGLSVDC